MSATVGLVTVQKLGNGLAEYLGGGQKAVCGLL
jgi:hypothetical protein